MRSMGRRRAAGDGWAPLYGRLQFAPFPADPFGPRMFAQLLNAAGEPLTLPLHYAHVRRIERGAMHLAGIELHLRGRKGSPERWRQSWLCVQALADAQPFLQRLRAARGGDDWEDAEADEMAGG